MFFIFTRSKIAQIEEQIEDIEHRMFYDRYEFNKRIEMLEKWIEKMPVPEGFITTSKIWTGEQEVPLPEEPTEVEEKEEERENEE